MKLTFSRAAPFEARGDALVYRIHKAAPRGDRRYSLTIFRPDRHGTILGSDAEILVINDDHDLLKLAKAVAQKFEDLGDGYKPSEHGHRQRHTEATLQAYDEWTE